MTNLMKSLAMLVVAVWVYPSAVSAQVYSNTVTPDALSSVSVTITDKMSGACWTNLREAREYAEEKLALEGYNVVAGQGNFVFKISLDGSRLSDGSCLGRAEITISNLRVSNGLAGVFEVGEISTFGIRPDNFNQVVLEMTSIMIDGM